MFRKWIGIVCAAALLLVALSACSSGAAPAGGGEFFSLTEKNSSEAGNAASPDAALVHRSQELTVAMAELANDELYLALMGAGEYFEEVVAAMAGGNYAVPATACVIPFSDDVYAAFLSFYGVGDTFSEAVLETVHRRMATAISSILIAQTGERNLAASNILAQSNAYQKTPGLEQSTLVALFYGGEYGTLTCFVPAEEGTMMVYTAFVPSEMLQELVASEDESSLPLQEIKRNMIRYEGTTLQTMLRDE